MKRPRRRRSGRIWRTSGADSLRGFARKLKPIRRASRSWRGARASDGGSHGSWGAQGADRIQRVLNTTDVDIAKKIAKAVRFSSGGLRYVKGAGFPVRGQAQVSMNLTEFEQTPIARVFQFVKREAARYGVMPTSSEIAEA